RRPGAGRGRGDEDGERAQEPESRQGDRAARRRRRGGRVGREARRGDLMAKDATYIHGTSAEEQDRLSLLNRLMNDAALRELRLQGGERIVDFGSGLGQLSLGMARGSGVKLVGIERSEEQLARSVKDPLLDLRQGDVAEPPLRADEWGTFDLAHARFVL